MDNNQLYHHGVKGMRWGVRKKEYRSTGLKAARARRANEKVDEGFRNWDENAKKRDNAIELGKKRNTARMAYENDRSNKDLKTEYKSANKEYKKALHENTTYRKGVVRQEVGKDISRKYLSEAKKVKKQLDADPTNKELQKRYNELMSKHAIERADARRAKEVGEKRSLKKASIKRTMTITAASVAGTAACTAGAYAVNRYLTKRDVRINGRPAYIGASTLRDLGDLVKRGRELLGYLY